MDLGIKLTTAGIAALVVILIFFVIGCVRGFVREAWALVGTILIFVITWFAQPYVEVFLRDNTPLYSSIEKGCTTFTEGLGSEMENLTLSSLDQAAVLRNSSIPEFLRLQLIDHNNAETYKKLGVSSFPEYIAAFIADRIYKCVTFLLTWVLAAILVNTIGLLLDIASHLPVLRHVNRLGGGLIGIARGFVLIWLLMVLMTVLCQTELGRKGLNAIKEDTVLSWVYEQTIERFL